MSAQRIASEDLRILHGLNLGRCAALVVFDHSGLPGTEHDCVRELLRRTLAALGRPASHLIRAPGGRPRLAGPAEQMPNIALSHSGAFVAVALAMRRPIGIDVQEELLGDCSRLSSRWLHATEHQAVMRSEEPFRRTLFTRIWTAREARCKATGEGLVGLRTREPLGGGTAGLCAGVRWRQLPAPPGYSAAVAWAGRAPVTGDTVIYGPPGLRLVSPE
jgi:phosphopantetheinyl transferase